MKRAQGEDPQGSPLPARLGPACPAVSVALSTCDAATEQVLLLAATRVRAGGRGTEGKSSHTGWRSLECKAGGSWSPLSGKPWRGCHGLLRTIAQHANPSGEGLLFVLCSPPWDGGQLRWHSCIDGPSLLTETERMAKEDEAQAVAAVIDRLAKKFPETPRTQVEQIVTEEYIALNDGPIRDYVPVLIERAAKLRLRS